jgi:hypothetical protein
MHGNIFSSSLAADMALCDPPMIATFGLARGARRSRAALSPSLVKIAEERTSLSL